MGILDINLRTYLLQNHHKLTWAERVNIIYDITIALERIHFEKEIHRDLHSGNILFKQSNQRFYITDIGFCGPANKSLNSVYGNLPYIAPEVIIGKKTTFASDIYSIGMLMWEVSSGHPPFINYEHDYDLAMKIVNGMRPKIVPGTPLEYIKLMEQCWDADVTKRPDANTLKKEMEKLSCYFHHNNQQQQLSNNYYLSDSIDSMSNNFNSKTYQFENLPFPFFDYDFILSILSLSLLPVNINRS